VANNASTANQMVNHLVNHLVKCVHPALSEDKRIGLWGMLVLIRDIRYESNPE